MTGRDKFIVVALIGLMVVASVAAIGADQNPASGDPAYGGTYVEGVAGVPQYLNPVIAATDVDEDVSRLAFSGLTRYDQTGAIVPDLASAFHTESDGRIWTFDIREDATWHDGQPVTADDVVFTVKRPAPSASPCPMCTGHSPTAPPFRSSRPTSSATCRMPSSRGSRSTQVRSGPDLSG